MVVTVGGAARSWALAAVAVYVVGDACFAVVQVGTVDIQRRLLMRRLPLRAYRLADRIPVLNTSINPRTTKFHALSGDINGYLPSSS